MRPLLRVSNHGEGNGRILHDKRMESRTRAFSAYIDTCPRLFIENSQNIMENEEQKPKQGGIVNYFQGATIHNLVINGNMTKNGTENYGRVEKEDEPQQDSAKKITGEQLAQVIERPASSVDFSPMAPSEVRARNVYKKLAKEDRTKVLRAALSALRVENVGLFRNKLCWIGVYFVVRDRLDGKINQTDFYDFAVSFTPDDWPDELRIGSTTFSNLARKVNYEDRSEAYYDMDNNPWDELCEKYWALVLNGLLTKD